MRTVSCSAIIVLVRNRLLSWVAGIALVAIVVIGTSGDASAEGRVALVVGNSNYEAAALSLPNPRNDAEDISEVLKSLGFEVKTTVDASKRRMDIALAEFARLASNADTALFFYAGHAMQFQGRNFLMPTDTMLEDAVSVRFQTVSLDTVSTVLERVNGVKIMILDASRNNPMADRLQKTTAGASPSVPTRRGLARVDKTQGMVVAYAAAADDVANDGQGRNGPFTAALLKRLQEPGLEIGIMFRRVAADVNAQTGGRQRPEAYISLLSDYYLNPGKGRGSRIFAAGLLLGCLRCDDPFSRLAASCGGREKSLGPPAQDQPKGAGRQAVARSAARITGRFAACGRVPRQRPGAAARCAHKRAFPAADRAHARRRSHDCDSGGVAAASLYANRLPIKKKPVELPMQTFAVAIVTLKNRTVSPLAQLFIDCAREVTRPLSARRPNPPGQWAGWKNRTSWRRPDAWSVAVTRPGPCASAGNHFQWSFEPPGTRASEVKQ